ncbi:TonB-dependent receptor domain-containing protein [Stenotrophomonas mori]|nr:TonB-dependent receptor [Stenotrophomonas mori]
MALALPVSAQEADGDKPVTLNSVEVTGSRIKGADMATQVPVLAITGEDLAATGLTSVGDILQQLSSSGSALNTKFSNAGNFGFPPDGSGVGSGSATLDLRHLGSGRVLVLVDGVRWVNESSASGVSGSVDLNTIPASIIDRIEILQDGASALYGSDAIAGVLNIITKRKQDGVSINSYWGTYPSLNGGTTTQNNISFGNSSDKLDLFADVSYVTQKAMHTREWARAANECIPGTGLANCSASSPYGRFRFVDPNTGVARDLTLNRDAAPGVPNYAGDFHDFTNADRYNYGPDNKLLTPSNRGAIFVSARYAVTPSTTWYIRGLYNNRRSRSEAAAQSLGFGPSGNTMATTISLAQDNIYNPFGFALDPQTNLISVNRRVVEAGNRVFEQDVDTYTLNTGFEGSFGFRDRSYYWDVNAGFGNNRASQRVTGTMNMTHVKKAVGSPSGCLAIEGCVPLNLWGAPGSITQEMLDYILFVEHDRSQNKIKALSANLSGSLFTLPAGDVNFATGIESRDYFGSYEPDALIVSGESNNVPSQPTRGRYDIREAYLELNAPLLADIPGIRALDLSLASRFSDYSTFGNTTNSKVGLRWQVFDDLTLRSTWAQGFRAPSIGEVYGAMSRFDATIQDPCSADAPGFAGVAAKCAALGVPNGYVQSGRQVGVQTGGNEALKPEESTSLTIGAVYSPSWAQNVGWADRMDITLGYYRIKLDGAIQALDAQTRLNRCVAAGDPNAAACENIVRSRTGDFAQFDNLLLNLGSIKTSGYDFGVNWMGPESAYGRFKVNLQGTYVAEYEAIDANGRVEPRTVGVELNNTGMPRLTANMRVGWALKAWDVDTTFRYISRMKESCAGAAGFPICNSASKAPNRPNGTHVLGRTVYQDLRASWKLPITLDMTVSAGINNLWDKEPPVCVSCSLNGFDASTHDLPGRFFYAQAGIAF